jgi:hypothetical protein
MPGPLIGITTSSIMTISIVITKFFIFLLPIGKYDTQHNETQHNDTEYLTVIIKSIMLNVVEVHVMAPFNDLSIMSTFLKY